MIDPEMFGVLAPFHWFDNGDGYPFRRRLRRDDPLLPRSILMSRIVAGMPAGMVDHINGRPLDNRRFNLRVATPRQNGANAKKTTSSTTSRYKGVSLSKGSRRNPWTAFIKVDRRSINLGSYPTEEDAAKVYDAAARRHFGEFARTNFPANNGRCHGAARRGKA